MNFVLSQAGPDSNRVVTEKCLNTRREDVSYMHYTSLCVDGADAAGTLPLKYAPLGVGCANIESRTVPSRFQMTEDVAHGMRWR